MNIKVIKAYHRNEGVIIEVIETDEGVVVNINGNASIYNNRMQLVNSKKEGILKIIPSNMIDWVKKHMIYSNNDNVEFGNGFTLYLDKDVIILRHWLGDEDIVEEELNNLKENDNSTLLQFKKELTQLKEMFTNKIELWRSHDAGDGTNYMDIHFKKCDFDSKLIDKIMDKWCSVNDSYFQW